MSDKLILKPAAPKPADTSLEDALVKALERDRLAKMTPAQRYAAALEAAKGRLSEASAGLTFEDLEAPPKDWNPDDWAGPKDEPEDDMVNILASLGVLK